MVLAPSLALWRSLDSQGCWLAYDCRWNGRYIGLPALLCTSLIEKRWMGRMSCCEPAYAYDMHPEGSAEAWSGYAPRISFHKCDVASG